MLDLLLIEAGAFYVMDRGYVDFRRLYRFTPGNGILRHPRQTKPRLPRAAAPSRWTRPLACAAIRPIVLAARSRRGCIPSRCVASSFYDAEHERRFVFLTNNFELPALTIARLYKMPLAGGIVLQVDQAASANQGFLRHIDNAVKTQVWIAISVYVLVAIVRKRN